MRKSLEVVFRYFGKFVLFLVLRGWLGVRLFVGRRVIFDVISVECVFFIVLGLGGVF